MINLTSRDYIEIVTGGFLIWFGIYTVARNPFSKLFWLVCALFLGFGFTIFSDSILLQTPTVNDYIKWQKITDWPLFLAPIFFYHISLLVKKGRTATDNLLIYIGYLGAIIFYALDIQGGYILKETELRFHNFRRMDGFEPGVLLIPSIVFVCSFILFGTVNYFSEVKKSLREYIYPAMSGLFILITGIGVAVSYYISFGWSDIFYYLGISFSLLLFAYGIVKYHLFSHSEKIFDKLFLYRTIALLVIISLYFYSYFIAGVSLTFPVYVLVILATFLLILTHSFYDWVSTFINDLVYNPVSGLSIVSDQEVSDVIKNYNNPERLENNSLLRLKVVGKKSRDDFARVDGLQKTIEEAIEYFKPKESSHRRTKRNLKYHLLKMLAFDEAEEGQILWELGFEEYPVRIMSNSRRQRPPLFETKSPSDYFYTSRNAYLALKKEAIHDITWRISYLEKLAKKKFF